MEELLGIVVTFIITGLIVFIQAIWSLKPSFRVQKRRKIQLITRQDILEIQRRRKSEDIAS